MTDENSTLFDRYDIQISNTERRNSSIAIQDCYIVYLIESRFVDLQKILIFELNFRVFRPKNSNNKETDSICVFRRYSDFETLRNYLVAKYSWVIVPVLPEKSVGNLSHCSINHNNLSRFLILGRNRIKIEQVSKWSNAAVFYSK